MNLGIVTVSDKGSRGERKDSSGPAIASWMAETFPRSTILARIVPDEKEMIYEALADLADNQGCRLIITTGGTGFGGRDVTPEATRSAIEKEAPGLAELLRLEGLKKTPFAVLSRGIAGIRGQALIVNLPGSEKAVKEGLETLSPLLPHAMELMEKGSLECGR